MRFDLSNELTSGVAEWRVRFFFGTSKDVRELELDGSITDYLRASDLFGDLLQRNASAFRRAEQELLHTSPAALQLSWTHKAEGIGPFAVTDQLGALADIVHGSIEDIIEPEDRAALEAFIVAVADSDEEGRRIVSESKLRRYASWVLAGIIVGDWFNSLTWHRDCRKAA